MNEYIVFINKLGLYCKMFNLEEAIFYHKDACSKDGNAVCYTNLKKGLDKAISDYEQLLKDNNYLDKDDLKKEILNKWPNISKLLLMNNLSEIRNQEEKLIYGMILEIVKNDLDFSPIYLFLVGHDLYNPNTACWVSSEPFYTILPTNDIHLFKEANKKVILDERTDFHILRNGDDVFEYACYYYEEATSKCEKEYWHDYLLWTLYGNLSVLDSRRFHGVDKKLAWDYKPVIYQIFENEKLAYLQDYLSTNEGILKQCHNTLYSSESQLEAIDFYIAELDKRGIRNKKLLELKK